MDFFYKIKRENNKYINKNKNEIKNIFIDKKIIDIYLDSNSNIKKKKINNELNELNVLITNNNSYNFSKLLDFDFDDCYKITSSSLTNKDFEIYKMNPNNHNLLQYIGKVHEIDDKYQNIMFNMVSSGIYSEIAKLDYCSREIYLYKYKLKIISYLFDFLRINGDFYFTSNIFCSLQIVNLCYLLSFMFDEVIVSNGMYFICKNFNPVIKKSDIIFDDNFNIEPKYKLNEFIKYQEKILLHNIKKNKLIINNDKYLFNKIILNESLILFKYYNKKFINKLTNDTNESLVDLIKSTYKNNNFIKSNSIIKTIDIIKKYKCKNILEIGFDYGITAFHILNNPVTKLTSIDQFQKTEWDNNGIKLLKEFKLDNRFTLYELPNFIALPKLLEKHGNNYYDFIFINGSYTFDNILLDFFFAHLLLDLNGFIVIDNALQSGINKCIQYIQTNYINFYKKIDSPITCGIFQKISEDKRDWNYHNSF